MRRELPGVKQAGYVSYTAGEAWWVCRQCFEDLREEMGWQGGEG